MAATLFQYATPISILSNNSWVGAVTDVDEDPPFNDADVMQSPLNSSISGLSFSIEYKLKTILNPNYYSDGFNVILRGVKSSSGSTQVVLFSLKQGSTIITSGNFTLLSTLSTQSWPLIPAEISSITDYSNLSLLLTAQPPLGGAGTNNVVLSGCALQTPSVGFDHLILNTTGYKIVGPHYGLWLKKGVTGYVEMTGSETVEALININTEY